MSKYLDPDFDDDLILDEQTVEGTAEEEVQVVDPKQLNILQLIERIVNRVEDSELKKSALDEVKGETEELASRLDITPADRLLNLSILSHTFETIPSKVWLKERAKTLLFLL